MGVSEDTFASWGMQLENILPHTDIEWKHARRPHFCAQILIEGAAVTNLCYIHWKKPILGRIGSLKALIYEKW